MPYQFVTYRGKRVNGECCVWVKKGIQEKETRLNPRLDLRKHSPTGFEWGYEGSGPAQLALAVLAHHCRDDGRALWCYLKFKSDVVARLPNQEWELTSGEIEAVLENIERSAV